MQMLLVAQPAYLEQLEGSALFQLLKHGPQMPPAAPSLLQICLVVSASKQGPRGICKVCLEGKQILQSKSRQGLQNKKKRRAAILQSCKACWVMEGSALFIDTSVLTQSLHHTPGNDHDGLSLSTVTDISTAKMHPALIP